MVHIKRYTEELEYIPPTIKDANYGGIKKDSTNPKQESPEPLPDIKPNFNHLTKKNDKKEKPSLLNDLIKNINSYISRNKESRPNLKSTKTLINNKENIIKYFTYVFEKLSVSFDEKQIFDLMNSNIIAIIDKFYFKNLTQDELITAIKRNLKK